MVNAYEIINETITAAALHNDKLSLHCLLNVFMEFGDFMNYFFIFLFFFLMVLQVFMISLRPNFY